ncbi:MAG: type VI secretion system tube protein Hcp [Acidobacteriia bacterium]|nr:type VI secretion system tube protein Hcp [Terriglobia bacterium]
MTTIATARLRVFGLATALVFVLGMGTAQAQTAGFIRVVTAQGALDGASKDPAYLKWIPVASVVAADLNGDAAADRESSAPSVSEITVAREHGSGMATGRTENIGSQSSGAGAGKASTGATTLRESPTLSSTGKTTVRESPTMASSGPREVGSGMATGKRMHKPLTIMKQVDVSSPNLRQLLVTGTAIPEVDVAVAQGGAGMRRYVLQNVMVTSIQSVSSGGDRPMESISFTYQKIEMK